MADKESTPPPATSARESSPLTPEPKRVKRPAPERAEDVEAEHAPQSSSAGNAAVPAELSVEEDEVEADHDNHSDSGFGTDNSDTTSVSSSIYAGYVENGRKYQTTREGEYWGPSDEKQFESMHANHLVHMVLDSLQRNPLFQSPVPDSVQNILDIGTGDGSWAQEVADRYPNAFVQGVDLYPPPNTWVPPNCRFEVDDVLKPWFYKEKFDLIHMRWMLGAFTPQQWDGLYAQAYKNLVPGGWIEQVECLIAFHCDDDTLPPGSLLSEWGPKLTAINDAGGKPIDTAATMAGRMEAAGFTNMHQKTYKVPTGDWPKNRMYKEAGRLNLVQFKEGMEGYIIHILTHQGWTAEQVRVYLAGVRKELEKGPHVYQISRRVWAQKPHDEAP